MPMSRSFVSKRIKKYNYFALICIEMVGILKMMAILNLKDGKRTVIVLDSSGRHCKYSTFV